MLKTRTSQLAHTEKGIIEYTLIGAGPVILSLHGGHSNCYEEFGYDALLQAGYSILTPSRPGYRRTPVSTGKTPEAAADALSSLLDHLQIDQVFVIAFSAGGPTGIYLASNYHDRVKKFVLESAISKIWITKGDHLYTIGEMFFNPITQKFTWWMQGIISNLFPYWMAITLMAQLSTLNVNEIMLEMSAGDIEEIRKMCNRYSSDHGFMLDLEYSITPEALENITIPTLIIHSKHDKSVPFDHGEHAAAHIKNSELFVAPTWGHLLWFGKGSQEVNQKLLEFLGE